MKVPWTESQEPNIHIGGWLSTLVTSVKLSVPSFPYLKNDKEDCLILRHVMIKKSRRGESEDSVLFLNWVISCIVSQGKLKNKNVCTEKISWLLGMVASRAIHCIKWKIQHVERKETGKSIYFSKHYHYATRSVVTNQLRTNTPKLFLIILRISTFKVIEPLDYHDVYNRHI